MPALQSQGELSCLLGTAGLQEEPKTQTKTSLGPGPTEELGPLIKTLWLGPYKQGAIKLG